jgi:tRNA U34 5-methylaminomethyl-2-thiouridine-forming methyltransferase MnmC
LYKILQPNGLVVTYSVKGSFRRALIESGFTVEKIPGPPGKREMLRAIK